MIKVVDSAGNRVPQEPDGAFAVFDQREYIIRSDEPLHLQGVRFLRVLPESGGCLATLQFENYVGLAECAGLRFRVQNSKITEVAFESLLHDVVDECADLAYDFGSPTGMPFDREELALEGIPYHALVYLRHVMLKSRASDRLSAQFLVIAKNPNRRIENEATWTDPVNAHGVGTAGLMNILAHPNLLQHLPDTSRMRGTGLSARLGGFFPTSVLADQHRQCFDTPENRLVKHVLEWAQYLTEVFLDRDYLDPRLVEELQLMRGELSWMLSFDFLEGVGALTQVATASTALQKKDGYREFFAHFLRLQQTSVLGSGEDLWRRLLELKDAALLYELWAFFQVKRILEASLGKPTCLRLSEGSIERRSVPWCTRLDYSDGRVELDYNLTHGAPGASYSIGLRPDIVIRVRDGAGWRSLVLDAKFRFVGERIDSVDTDYDWDRSPTRDDLCKMHAYRDAIREAVGAFILYPGSQVFSKTEEAGSAPYDGIGAVPLEPGKEEIELKRLVTSFVR